MILLRPPRLPIHDGHLDEHGALVAAALLVGKRLSAIYLGKYSLYLLRRIVLGVELLDAVVTQAAADALEETVTHAQGIHERSERTYLDTRHLGQTVYIRTEGRGVLHGHGLVGAPRRQHAAAERLLAAAQMVFERVDGIIRSAYHLHVITPQQPTRRIFGLRQQGIATVVYRTCRGGAQQLLHAEGGLEFEMRPVIQRVAHGIWYRLGPLLETLPIRSVTRTVTLRHTVRTHGAPLVVVAVEPYLRKAAETVILGYVARVEMAMVIYDRHLGRMVVIETACRLGLQQEVLVVEFFHNFRHTG